MLAQSFGAFNAGLFAGLLVGAPVAQSVAASASAPSVALVLVLGAYLLPLLLFWDIAGQLADKYEKARLARILKALEIPVMTAAGIAVILHSQMLLLCAVALFSMLLTLFTPLKHAIVSAHLREEELVSSNVLLVAGTVLGFFAGALGGGALAIESGRIGWLSFVCGTPAIFGYVASKGVPAAPASDPGLRLGFNFVAGAAWHVGSSSRERTSYLSLLAIAWFWISMALFLYSSWWSVDAVSAGKEQWLVSAAALSAGVCAGLLLGDKLCAGHAEFGWLPVAAIGQAVLALDLAFLAQPGSSPAWRGQFDLFVLGASGGLLLPTLYVHIQSCGEAKRRARMASFGLFLGAATGLPIAWVLMWASPGSASVLSFVAVCCFLLALFAYRLEAHLTLRFLTWLLIHAFYRVEKNGFEHIPRTGPAVLVCNHVSFVDSVVIMAAIRRPIRFVMDHRIHQTPVVGFIFRHSRTIPIATAKEDPAMKESAFAEVARALRNGELIGLFPEGRITHTGEINHFRYGVGRIVEETPVPVVPMALRGLWGSFFSRRYGPAMSKPMLLRWLAKVELVVGQPVQPERGTPEYLQEVVTDLRGGMV
ncbi:MAG: 1-acyl-sn-glycerol-3-phosphate acyltransferase [Propionivibrio sp.]